MKESLNFFANMFTQLWGILDGCMIRYDSVSVSLGSIITVFMIIGFAIAVFWKGAKT